VALASLGVLDLSVVTDHLVALLNDAVNTSPLWDTHDRFDISVSGSPPETVRSGSECELSVYLFHVGQERFNRNFPAQNARLPLIPYQPMNLDLYYLLSAYSGGDYVEEQQAMSIALRCFHGHPIVHTPAGMLEDFTLLMEIETSDELGRLWQATTAAMRLATVYKVSVVFVTPPQDARPIAKAVTQVSLTGDVVALPLSDLGEVIGTRRRVTYAYPTGSPLAWTETAYESAPATAAPGEQFLLVGGGLGRPTSSRVYLVASDGTETDVTVWKAQPATAATDSRVLLELPAASGAAPGSTPPPGVYSLRVGSDVASGDAATVRSNATPFSIAARIDVTADPPVLTAAGGLYTVDGAGFVAGATQVLLDAVALQPAAGPPAAGHFRLNAGGTRITFRTPAGLPAGRYRLRVRVNGIESQPGWWLLL
jgi:hypothetical protein